MVSDPKWINADLGVPEYNAAELRRLEGAVLFKGVVDRFGARQGVHPSNDPAVTVAGTTWTVEDINAVVYPGLSDQDGPYVVAHPSESGSLDPADGTNPRIDALDLQIQDDDEDASGERRAQVVYVTGTPGASPVAPALTATSLRLATILVPATGTPAPTVDTLGQFTVAAGGVPPVRTTAERPAAGRYHGMLVYRQDGDVLEVWDGSAWVAIAGPGVSPATVQDIDATTFAYTNTAYATTGGAVVGVTFLAPSTGRVMLHWHAGIDIAQDTGAAAHLSVAVRTGGTIGSGTTVLAAADDRSVRVSRSTVGTDLGGARTQMGVSYLLSGLTAGDTYNARLEHRVTSQTGELFRRHLQVAPAT